MLKRWWNVGDRGFWTLITDLEMTRLWLHFDTGWLSHATLLLYYKHQQQLWKSHFHFKQRRETQSKLQWKAVRKRRKSERDKKGLAVDMHSACDVTCALCKRTEISRKDNVVSMLAKGIFYGCRHFIFLFMLYYLYMIQLVLFICHKKVLRQPVPYPTLSHDQFVLIRTSD